MHEEFELKLALSADQRERLRSSTRLRALACGDVERRRLVNTYFDTPDQDLRRRGMALRIRQVDGRRLQTLKADAGDGGGLQHTREYETEVGAERPDLSLIDDRKLRARLRKEVPAEALAPIFTARFNRETVPMQLDGGAFALSIDSGEIEAGDRRLPICEAELELVAGRPGQLYELALALHGEVGFRLEGRSKAARGYALRAGEQPQPTKATAVELTEDMTAADAFVAAVRACLRQIRVNEQVVMAGRDPEGVHQMRVGVRRLRALLRAFDRIVAERSLDYLRRELRWLQQRLGPAREWDVFIHETLEPLQAELPDDPSLAALHAAAKTARSDAYRQARRAIVTRRYTKLLLRLELWLEQGGWAAPAKGDKAAPGSKPARRYAAKALSRRDRKLRKLGDKRHDLSLAELHRVRIGAKQVRYAADAFRALFPAAGMKDFLAVLEDIQDALGTLNDSVVSHALLAGLIERIARRDAKRAAVLQRAADLVEARQQQRIARDLTQFGDCWKRYGELERVWER